MRFLLVSCLVSPVLTSLGGQHRKFCRKNKGPHQQGLWQAGFPVSAHPKALCEGTIVVDETTGEICITGRVNYQQIAETVRKPIRAPAAETISVTGHLVSGSANVVLGPEATFLYDYVTQYTIDGVDYLADSDMIDRVLAGSRGIIDGLCFDSSFAQEEAFYRISHKVMHPAKADPTIYRGANIIFASAYSLAAEFHEFTDNDHSSFGTPTAIETTSLFANIVPGFLFKIFPFLGATGIFRSVIKGTVSTAKYPQPLTAPDPKVENVQIDTEWDNLMTAMDAGLFRDHDGKIPLYFGAVIKRIEGTAASNGCWKGSTAAIDLQAPPGNGDKLDAYVNDVVFPALSAGTVGLHLGKRLDSGSAILQAAMDTYEACGAETSLTVAPEGCYHPACSRSADVSSFTYPEALFA